MAGPVEYAKREGIALITLASPPANILNLDLRGALNAALDRAEADPQVTAVVLTAKGAQFSAGVDVRDIGATVKAGDPPDAAALCNRLESFRVPVVAALQGLALGAGAELALACHYRLASPDAGIALSEVTLGLLPSAGGVLRLPRLCGAEVALSLMLTGRTMPAAEARAAGILSGVINGQVLGGAFEFARTLGDRPGKTLPTRERRDGFADPAAYAAAIAKARAAIAKTGSFAAARIIDCVEAAFLLPYPVAVEFSDEAYRECLAHSQSAALRHMFIAERRTPRSLLTRGAGGRWQPTPTAEQQIVEPLRQARQAAIDHIVGIGATPAQLDAACLHFGFATLPFGLEKAAPVGPETPLIQRRIVAAIMVQGAQLLQNGVVRRASDIDALAVHGMGFPRQRGGPMKAAHLMGLVNLRSAMQRWSGESQIWAVPDLVNEAIKYAAGFDALDDQIGT